MKSLKLSHKEAAWYPPSETTPVQNEDNPNVLEFQQQRSTKQPNPISWNSIKKIDDDDEIEEILEKTKKRPKKNNLNQEDIVEYNDMMEVPRGDQTQFQGPSYGQPDFFYRAKLSKRA